jgi:hypothetical protein
MKRWYLPQKRSWRSKVFQPVLRRSGPRVIRSYDSTCRTKTTGSMMSYLRSIPAEYTISLKGLSNLPVGECLGTNWRVAFQKLAIVRL